MLFKVTEIEFDFDGEELTTEEKVEITEFNIGAWEADDEDDLIDEISTASGWCIKSIDYYSVSS